MQQKINRIVTTGKEAKDKLLDGVNSVCDVVGSTIGARGSNNLFETLDSLPWLTKDGYDSLNMMYLPDPIENMACEMVKEACNETHSSVGDNTSATCVLVQSFFQNSLKAVEDGENPIEVSQKILKSVDIVADYIDGISVDLDNKLMYNIAKTAGNGDDEIAKTVTDAFLKAGEYGSVSHKRSMSNKTTIEFIKGNPIDSGYAHEGYVNIQETQSVVFDNPLVIVSETYFQTINELYPFLAIAFPKNEEGVPFIAPRPLVIIGTMEDNISTSLLSNVRESGLPIAVIKPPYLGARGRETMADLALIFGCDLVEGVSKSDYKGKEISLLGTCERIEIGMKDTVVTIRKDIDQSKIQGKISELTSQIKNEKRDSQKNYLKDRIAKISGGIATIMVGGVTPSETEERIARIDDAVSAVRAAKEEGVVAGGGTALLNASMLENIDKVTAKSLKATYLKILENAGNIPADVTPLGKYPIGYDVMEYKIVDMFEAGIIDTAKGVKSSFKNAASASNNMLRTNFVLPYKRIENGN